ncbi:hypothetical protein K432DRAFT_387931 [Lepidopterella palustris CBS 459.81]|uniref:Zn(2)-C6 fungal-type domain-containing protein n=1 Tax=Lepidopterella palustris CBS 459.81 TaxID=1314670 RepID=A0A8E2JKP8_9PEZI|nr:hypothetical protein K432DRAFT_387931 [Lepidopterella palustris CBS 459.81]
MPPETMNTPSGSNYWYGNGLSNGVTGPLSEDVQHHKMLRSESEVLGPFFVPSQDPPRGRDVQQTSLHLDTSQVSSLVIRPQLTPDSAHKAPLAPKQGFVGALASTRAQHHSPISGTYALRTPRGKITSIACESCRKRKSKCDGLRPRCNTCKSKNLSCIYDVAEDGKTTTQLRGHVRRLARELDDVKSILTLLIVTPDRTGALTWAREIETNGFAHHCVDEIRKSLHGAEQQQKEIVEGLSSEEHSQSSYDGSSREQSREHSQPASNFHPESAMGPRMLFTYTEPDVASKFSFDCSFYRRTKRELLANGWGEVQIFGDAEIDVDSILFGLTDAQDGQVVPTWASRMVSRMLGSSSLPVRLASAFILTKMMRWMIWPSMENMNDMPDWLMPSARTDCTPYDILIDTLPWPALRQYLYQHPGEFVVGAFVGFVSVSWPYTDENCYYWDIDAGCTRLTALFENHINDLNSWTMDSKALRVMPQLEGLVPIRVS